MSSNDIYTPFFYIIQHTPSGKKYAGSKYGRMSNPKFFMTPKGYTTSSKLVNILIEKDGFESFKILTIREFSDGDSTLKYETNFLETNDCANSEEWLNFHNNVYLSKLSFSDIEKIMVEKYNDKRYNLKRAIETNKERYGVNYPLENIEIWQKTVQSLIDKYGVDIYSKTPEGRKLNSRRAQIQSTCPHCNKTAQHINIIRHHFNNCFLNPTSKKYNMYVLIKDYFEKKWDFNLYGHGYKYFKKNYGIPQSFYRETLKYLKNNQ